MSRTQALPLPARSPSKWRLRYDKARTWTKRTAIPFAKFKVREYAREAKSNIYTVFGLTCFAAAGFVHSVFTGLIVTGCCWLALELKARGT